jgi:dUTP pyrophosphatase
MMLHISGSACKSSITNVLEQDVQPNAVDVRLDKVFRIKNSVFILDEQTKTNRGTEQLLPDSWGYFELPIGSYEVVMKNMVTIASGEAGHLKPRSTLVRNAIRLETGLYDAGYSGLIVCCIHVTTGPWLVRQGTRIAQFILEDAETLHEYKGQYGMDQNGVFKKRR